MKRNTFAQNEFWYWILASLIISLLTALIAYFKIAVHVSSLDDQSSVALVALCFTLPVTFAAAIAVIKLGDRTDEQGERMAALAAATDARANLQFVRQEVRENYQLARQEYLEVFNVFQDVAQVLYKTRADLIDFLLKIKAEKYKLSEMDPEQKETLSDECGTFDKITLIDGSVEKSWVGADLGEVVTHQCKADLVANLASVRDEILKVVDSALNKLGTMNVKSAGGNPYKVLVELSRLIVQRNAKLKEYQEFSDSNTSEGMRHAIALEIREMNESLAAIQLVKKMMDNYISTSSGAVKALVHLRVLLSFSKNMELHEEFFSLALHDYYAGSLAVDKVFDIIFGWTICSAVFSKVPSAFAEDEDGREVRVNPSADKVREHIAHGSNNLGSLAIDDLISNWPDKNALVDCVFAAGECSGIENEVRQEVKKKLKDSMPDPKVLVKNMKTSTSSLVITAVPI